MANDPQQAHEALVDYFRPYYPNLTRDELRSKIFTDTDAFNNALKEYHKDNYQDRDFNTFKTQYLKKFGTPMGDSVLPKDMQEYRLDTNPSPVPFLSQTGNYDAVTADMWLRVLGADGMSSAGQKATDETITPGDQPDVADLDPSTINWPLTQDPALADRLVPDILDPKKQKLELEKMVRAGQDESLQEIRELRQGNTTLPANQFYQANPGDGEERKDVINRQRRMLRRTPVERTYGVKKGEKTLSAYDQEVILLQDEMNTLAGAVKSLDRQLMDKYGSDVFNLIQNESEEYDQLKLTVANDPLWSERNQWAKLYDLNSDVAANLAKQPEFEKVLEVLKLKDTMQALADVQTETGGLLPSTVLMPYPVQGAIMRSFGKLLEGIGTIADVTEEIVTTDETYNGWDRFEDFLKDFGRDIQDVYFPLPSAANRPLKTNQAQLNIKGSDVVVDYDNNNLPIQFRNKFGTVLPLTLDDLDPLDQLKVVQQDPEGKWNMTAGLIQTGEILADLAIQVGLTRGIGSGVMKIGLPVKAAESMALTTATGAQMAPEINRYMIDTFGDTNNAAYATMAAIIGVGALANLSGMEKSLAGLGTSGWGKQIAKKTFTKQLQTAIKGLSPAAAAATVARHIGKTVLGETFEETLGEKLVIDGAKVMFGGQPDPEINWNELRDVAIMTIPVALLGGSFTAKGALSGLEGNALYTVSQDPTLSERTMKELHRQGALKIPNRQDPDMFIAQQRDRFIDIAKQFEAVEDQIPSNLDRGELALFFDKRRNLKLYLERSKAFDWGEEKIKEIESEYEGYNQALSTALRTGQIPTKIGPAQPSPERAFIEPEPTLEPEPESEITNKLGDFEGNVVSYRGRIGQVVKDPDGVYRVRDRSGRSRGNLGSDPNVSIDEFGLKDRSNITFEPTPPTVPEETTPLPEEPPPTEPTSPEPTEPPPAEELPEPQLPGEDITPEDVIADMEKQLDVAMGLEENDFANRPYTELEGFLGSIDHPVVQQALENFRSLPEHPANLSAEERTDPALQESFERHKRNLVAEMASWSTLDPSLAYEMENPDFDQDAYDAEIEAAASEVEAQGGDATELRSLMDRPPLTDEDIDALMNEALEGEEDIPTFEEFMNMEEEAQKVVEDWDNMDEGQLNEARGWLKNELEDATQELAKAQSRAQEEAIEIQSVHSDADVIVSDVISELTVDERQRVKSIKAKLDQINKILADKSIPFDPREATQAATTGAAPGFANTDLGFMGTALDKITQIYRYAADLLTGSQRLSDLINQFVPYEVGVGIGSDKAFIKLQNQLRYILTSTGKLGNHTIWDLNEQRKNLISRYESEGELIDKEFRKAVKTQFKKPTAGQAKEIDTILRDPNLATQDTWTLSDGTVLNPEIVESLRRMRNLVDKLSKELIDAGVVDGDLVTILTDNMGIYLTRHYRVHFDEAWKRNMMKFKDASPVYHRARQYLGGQLTDALNSTNQLITNIQDRISQANNELVGETDQNKIDRINHRIDFWEERLIEANQRKNDTIHRLNDIDSYIESILNSHISGEGVFVGGTLGAKNLGILMERAKSVRAPIRRKIKGQIESLNNKIKKTNNQIKALERALLEERGRKRPMPQLIRDKKKTAQRLMAKEERRLAATERQLTALTNQDTDGMTDREKARHQSNINKLEVKGDVIQAKIDNYKQRIAQLTDEIDIFRNIPYASVAKIEDRLTKLRDDQVENARQLNDKLTELEEVRRLDIPKEIRDLLGEVEDPSMNFAATIHKQAMLLSNHKFLDNIRNAGLNRFLFTNPTTAPNGESATRLLAAESSDTLYPLNGLYTTDAVFDAFKRYEKMHHDTGILSKVAYFAGALKMNLTVLYHLTGLRNMFSAGMYSMLQGEITPAIMASMNWLFMDGNIMGIALQGLDTALPGLKLNERLSNVTLPWTKDSLASRLIYNPNDSVPVSALKWTTQAVTNMLVPDANTLKNINEGRNATFGIDVWERPAAELEADYLWAKESGLFDEDFSVRQYYEALERFKGKTLPPEISGPPQFRPPGTKAQEQFMWVYDKGKAGLKWLRDKSAMRYRSSDNLGRLFRAKQERDNYARSWYGKSYEDLTLTEKQRVDQRAAEVAKRTYPTLSQVPPFVKEFSRFPFLGDFVTFVSGNTRAVLSTPQIALEDLRDPHTVGLGIQRLAGLAVYAALPQVIQSVYNSILGNGYDDDERDTLDLFEPDFNKGAPTLKFKVLDEKGNIDPTQFYTINMGSILPVTAVTDPFVSALGYAAGKNSIDEVGQSVMNLIRPFASTGILYESFLEAVYNTKELGRARPIYPDNFNLAQKFSRGVAHVSGFRSPFVFRFKNKELGYWRDPDLKPGLIVPGTVAMMYRTGKSALGIPTSYGTLYNPYHEALRWMLGTTVMKINIEEAVKSKHKNVAAAMEQLDTEWNRVKYQAKFKALSDEEFWDHPEVRHQMEIIQEIFDRQIRLGQEYFSGGVSVGLDPNDMMKDMYVYPNNKVKRTIRYGGKAPFNFAIKGRSLPPGQRE